ncbi:MAG: stage II sporulation protein M [Candidatus Woesearchaeota archaeon]
MVLELIVNPKKATGKPWEMFFIGAAYSSVAAFLALWIFKNYVSIVMITLTIIASIPFMRSVINQQEEKDRKSKQELSLLKEHSKAIKAFMYLFLGFTFTFTLLYIFMPSAIVERMFSAQLETIITVQSGSPTGDFIGSLGIFNRIFLNNFKILIFCMAFSFFYGAGAIFILTWNASVMATAIGSFIRNNLFYAKGAFDYFQVTMFGLLQYLLHGIPEIFAYFIGALASGIVSFALIKHDYMSPKFKTILKDVGILFGISIIILLVAALIEVFITPALV